jgi:hypothetical protein
MTSRITGLLFYGRERVLRTKCISIVRKRAKGGIFSKAFTSSHKTLDSESSKSQFCFPILGQWLNSISCASSNEMFVFISVPPYNPYPFAVIIKKNLHEHAGKRSMVSLASKTIFY